MDRFGTQPAGAALLARADADGGVHVRECPGKGNVQWDAVHWLPAVDMPAAYTVLDLTSGEWEKQTSAAGTVWSVGKYDETRVGVYNTDLFEGSRNHHMGVDIGGPVGTPVKAIAAGTVHSAGYNPAPGDYGNVVVLEYAAGAGRFWMLYGHLSAASVRSKVRGQRVAAGEIIGWFGDRDENGGWVPHVHIQLSLHEPKTHDMPGVVALKDRLDALAVYPDPRLVLGPLY